MIFEGADRIDVTWGPYFFCYFLNGDILTIQLIILSMKKIHNIKIGQNSGKDILN